MSVVWVPKGIRGWLVLAAALVTMAVTARLGWWQLDRAAQKQALHDRMAAHSTLAALGNAQWSDVAAAAQVSAASPSPVHGDGTSLLERWLHRPVLLQGRWQKSHTVFLDNRQMQGRPGFYVLTPLLLQGGGAVLVQRGWVPRNFQDRTALPDVTTPDGLVLVQGRIAPPPAQLFALGEGAPDAIQPRIRQNVEMTALARETGLPLPPLSVVQTGEDGEGLSRQWPQPALGLSKHYGYAFQWFGLSLLVLVLYLWFQILRPWRRARLAASHAH